MLGLGLSINRTHSNGVAPQFTANPVITAPSFEVGQTLTCSDGTVTGTEPITYSYQWYRGVTAIGADQNTYVPVIVDNGQSITCEVTPSNAYGSTSATSAAVIILYQSLSSYYFDGVNNNISYGSTFNSIIEGTGKTFAIRLIFRRLTTGIEWIWSNWNDATSKSSLILFRSTNQLKMFMSSDGTTNTGYWEGTTQITDTLWHDFIINYNNGAVTAFLDGAVETGTSTTIPTTLFASTANSLLGQGASGGVRYRGWINQFAIVPFVVTEANAIALYNSGKPRLTSDVLASETNVYDFDEDTFNGTNWSSLNVLGVSHGTSSGMIATDHDNNENPY